ncbi:MAG: hypothetical protein HQ510_05910 [Candidatus Marinimicrobia bacterium]|nr:hypothetical protein [Candidatus Neomarinimicrobiota bacterium]
MNQDQYTNVLDVVRIVNVIMGDSPDDYERWFGDVNNDGIELVQLVDIISGSTPINILPSLLN